VSPSAAPGHASPARTRLPRLAAHAALAGLFTCAASPAAQIRAAFLPVGVEHPAGQDARTRARDLEEIRRLRFNVVQFTGGKGTDATPGALLHLDRLLAGAPDPRVMLPIDTAPARLPVRHDTMARDVTVAAWTAVARGAGGVMFAGWRTLVANADALSAASQFAEAITRNMALYAPLRPVATSGDDRQVQVTGRGNVVGATLLESAAAIVLIAVNPGSDTQTVTMTFSADVPEAIWQDMLAGGTVNFVASAGGPVYERTFPPGDVLVLAIGKERR
jgi:hypothetical protein